MTKKIEVHSDAWHSERREGFGGSDMVSMFGMSRFTSPLDLYRSKLGQKPPDETSPAAQRGHDMEPYILGRMAQALDLDVSPGATFVRHPQWDDGVRIQANTDGGARGFVEWNYIRAIAECKSTRRSAYVARSYYKGRTPIYHWLQVLIYGKCLGLEDSLVGCVIGPDDDMAWSPTCGDLMVVWVKPCDESREAISMMERLAKRFWRAIEAGEKPSFTRHPWADKIEELHAASDQDVIYRE